MESQVWFFLIVLNFHTFSGSDSVNSAASKVPFSKPGRAMVIITMKEVNFQEIAQ